MGGGVKSFEVLIIVQSNIPDCVPTSSTVYHIWLKQRPYWYRVVAPPCK